MELNEKLVVSKDEYKEYINSSKITINDLENNLNDILNENKKKNDYLIIQLDKLIQLIDKNNSELQKYRKLYNEMKYNCDNCAYDIDLAKESMI